MRHKFIFFFVLLGCLFSSTPASLNASTIVKENLIDVSPNKKDLVFYAFSDVPLYYLVSEEGDGLVDQYSQEDSGQFPGLLPKTPEGFVITLFYNQHIANEMKSIIEKKNGRRLIIRSTTLKNILHKQYARIGKPPSRDPNNPDPDFLVVNSLFHLPAFPEFLMNIETEKPYVQEHNGQRFIPAFIAHNIDAIRLQNNLGGEAVYRRVGLDFKSFLKFVEEYAESDTPVAVFFGSQSELDQK